MVAMTALPVLAQPSAGTPSWANPPESATSGAPRKVEAASACVPGAQIEALSEGAWYPAVVLDPLRDGRCFIHYDGYGSDDDEALSAREIRSRR
ncbi:hypothetical protein CU669_13535 [Paramagnetospirillum kuznetsovii]|uniref:Agenet-like domain-containing protein n=1 Tax=Paramagnetospirillum kuznetsovii TaxID=2053833 RepID=A0A364NWM0_9PROT|nr:hypothetical protein [Paramagnetospirillum kuznetsovii]RAU21443.1 hypothetical protein CU669_13535 [Paramagnetospirillum kuznetsovii]